MNIIGKLNAVRKQETASSAVDRVHEAAADWERRKADVATQEEIVAALTPRMKRAAHEGTAEFDTLDAQMQAEQRTLRRLQLALDAAEQKLADERTAQKVFENAQVIKTLKRLGSQRVSTAAELAGHVEALVKSWRALHETNDRMRTAFPGSFPAGALSTPNELLRAVQAELYRVGANPNRGGSVPVTGAPTIPGAVCPDLMLTGTPERIVPLLEQLRAANEFVLGTIGADTDGVIT